MHRSLVNITNSSSVSPPPPPLSCLSWSTRTNIQTCFPFGSEPDSFLHISAWPAAFGLLRWPATVAIVPHLEKWLLLLKLVMMDRIAGSEAETRLANFKSSGQQDNTQRGTFPPWDVNVPYICRILCQVSWGKAREPCLVFFFCFPCSKRNRQMGHSDSGCHSSCPATAGLWNSWCSSRWHRGVWKAECRLRHSITMRPQCLASCWKGEPVLNQT